MIHMRAFVPADLTPEVLEVLSQAPSVSAIAVHTGACVKPAGDVITADVAREGANAIVDALRGLGVAEDGTLHIEPIPTWMSAAALECERHEPGASADAVVWSEVANRAYEESELNWTYLSFMVLATLLAAIAVILDSQILTIGAMVLGPEFTPIAALGLALVRRRPQLLRLASGTLVIGFVVAIAATALVSLAGRALGWISADAIAANRATAFIYHPDRWSLVVAVIAAAAGVLSLTSSRVGGLSGVFISVTTIPAAGNLGLGLALGLWSEVTGSAAQLAINLSAMALAGWATLAIQAHLWSRVKVWQPRRLSHRQPATSRYDR